MNVGGVPVDQIVEELIHIEQLADAVLQKVAKDKTTLTKRIRDEIESRTAIIDNETQETINRLHKAASEETDTRTREIAAISQRGVSTTEAAFEQHRACWQAELTKRVLYGS